MLQGAAFRVLACFYYDNEHSFVDLCEQAGYPTDLGGYYIRQLVQGGYLAKIERGRYRILPEGKRHLAFHYGKKLFAPHPRLAVAIVAQQDQSFVIMRRKVQPFIGTAEWPAGMVNIGEAIQAAASRIVQDRLGVRTKPHLAGFFRRIDIYSDTVFDDKLFAVHTCTIASSIALSPQSTVGEIVLCPEAELHKLEHASKALLEIFNHACSANTNFEEYAYTLSSKDLDLN